MLKYVQTQIPMPLYKRLRIEALERNMGLGDLLLEILTNYSKEEIQDGSKETEKGLVRTPPGKNLSSRRK